MPIASVDQYIASKKQRLTIVKNASRTSVALIPFTVFDLAGQVGAGVLAGTSTANGLVPTDLTVGFPLLDTNTGTYYLTKIEYANTVICRMHLYDMLFKAGAYAFTGGTTNLTAQPSIATRCPEYIGSGTIFGNGVELWVEVSTAFVTGTNWQIQVTYTNQSGTAGRTSIISVAQAVAGLTLGKMFQMSLQAGDSGVQKVESVVITNGATAMTAGAVNVLLLRQLNTDMRVRIANEGAVLDLLTVGMPVIYDTSALMLMVQADGVSTGLPHVVLEVASA